MKYRLEITAEAEAELHEAYQWIFRESPARAAGWRRRLLDKILTLRTNPERCPLAPESLFFVEDIRQMLFGRRMGIYRILFSIEKNCVYILHVRHASRRFLGDEDAE